MSTRPEKIVVLMENSYEGARPVFATSSHEGASGFADHNGVVAPEYHEVTFIAYPTWGLDPDYTPRDPSTIEDLTDEELNTKLAKVEAEQERLLSEVRRRVLSATDTSAN